jgi:hypothetical protein
MRAREISLIDEVAAPDAIEQLMSNMRTQLESAEGSAVLAAKRMIDSPPNSSRLYADCYKAVYNHDVDAIKRLESLN